jgi:hypothetical protein
MRIPTVFAASRIDVPSGTETGRPSIVSDTIFFSAIMPPPSAWDSACP